MDGEGCRCFFKEFMGNLKQDTHPIAGLTGGVLAGAVLQLFHDLQGVVHRLVGGMAVNSNHRADAAGVVFPLGNIQSFLLHGSHLSCLEHRFGPCVLRTVFPLKFRCIIRPSET